MKTSIKILSLAVSLVVMDGCSAQKRAQRQVRRAVEKCPELVQVKAHLIDTVLTVPAFADVTTIPWDLVATGDTIYAATPNGTVVVSLSRSDSSLRVGFVAAPQRLYYQDTIHYAQVVVNPKSQTVITGRSWKGFSFFLLGIAACSACFFLLRNYKKANKNR